MNASIRAQHKHEPAMKALRVNGKIERGYNPKTPSNFPYHSKIVPLDDTPT